MTYRVNRREFVGSLAALPLAARTAFAAQAARPSFPIIDTHIHLFDKTRPEGAPWPLDLPNGGEPAPGMIALPNRYQAIVAPFGVVGAIVVEASLRPEDNPWLLGLAANSPILVGVVGGLNPLDPGFGQNLDRLSKNPLFLGIRDRPSKFDNPAYAANLKLLADADCSLDVDVPRQGFAITQLLVKAIEKVPSLRLVLDHLPDVRFPDRATKDTYVEHLKQLGAHPQVYIKLSEVVRKWGDRVSTDVYAYRDWLDELWSIFGEDRVMFGSDWPNSENVEINSYPNVFSVARAYVATKGPAAMEKVFWKNSMKPYRWVQRLPSQRKA